MPFPMPELAFFVVTHRACSTPLDSYDQARTIALTWVAGQPGPDGWYAIVRGPAFPGPSPADLADVRAALLAVHGVDSPSDVVDDPTAPATRRGFLN